MVLIALFQASFFTERGEGVDYSPQQIAGYRYGLVSNPTQPSVNSRGGEDL